MAMVGESPSFVDTATDPTARVATDHPAKPLLLQALRALDRGHIRVVVECLYDAMSTVADHDDIMNEF